MTTSPKRREPATMSETLRAAIVESGISYRSLSIATGVQRASIYRFADGRQSIRLDVADKLAAYFGLSLRKD